MNLGPTLVSTSAALLALLLSMPFKHSGSFLLDTFACKASHCTLSPDIYVHMFIDGHDSKPFCKYAEPQLPRSSSKGGWRKTTSPAGCCRACPALSLLTSYLKRMCSLSTSARSATPSLNRCNGKQKDPASAEDTPAGCCHTLHCHSILADIMSMLTMQMP